MGKEIKYKEYFNVAEYYTMVNDIVDGYFSEDGSFAPHIGDMSAMLTFFNNCVLNKQEITEKEFIEEVVDAEVLFANTDFIVAFNEAIYFDGDIKYDFSNIYKNAMEIVQYRIGSIQYAVNKAMNGLDALVKSINSVMNEDVINNLTEFAQNVSDGKYDAKAVADAFAETEAFKKIAEMERGE